MTAPDSGAPDPDAPLFFLSYAHAAEHRKTPAAPREANAKVQQFFLDLSEHVSELVGRPAGADPGFMDSTMGGGQRWSPELLDAAGRCQVFVPLISPSLLGSAWCGMEWDAFSRRRIVKRHSGSSDHETGIVPVTWSPPDANLTLPKVIRDIQRFHPAKLPDASIAAQYQREGVYGLLVMRMEAAYQAVVWRLAQHIVGIYHRQRVEPRVPGGPAELRNVFEEQEVDAE